MNTSHLLLRPTVVIWLSPNESRDILHVSKGVGAYSNRDSKSLRFNSILLSMCIFSATYIYWGYNNNKLFVVGTYRLYMYFSDKVLLQIRLKTRQGRHDADRLVTRRGMYYIYLCGFPLGSWALVWRRAGSLRSAYVRIQFNSIQIQMLYYQTQNKQCP